MSTINNKVPASNFLKTSNSFITRVCFIYLFATYTYDISMAIVASRVSSLSNDFKIFKDFKVGNRHHCMDFVFWLHSRH